jgi:hypothetical protein
VEFFATFKQMHGALRARVERDVAFLAEATQALEKLAASASGEQAAELQKLLARVRAEQDEKKLTLE